MKKCEKNTFDNGKRERAKRFSIRRTAFLDLPVAIMVRLCSFNATISAASFFETTACVCLRAAMSLRFNVFKDSFRSSLLSLLLTCAATRGTIPILGLVAMMMNSILYDIREGKYCLKDSLTLACNRRNVTAMCREGPIR